MHNYRHWTPRYAFDRVRLLAFSVTHPRAPWLAPDAVRFIETRIGPHHTGFEWGAGRSTAWFARRAARLTSIEHDERWYWRVDQTLRAKALSNVTLRWINVPAQAVTGPAADATALRTVRAYVDAINTVPDASLDFVLVDGISQFRDACTFAAIPKVRPGGVLIVDDIHRYLPSNSRAPLALPRDAAPLTPVWREVSARLGGWDYRCFTSGVTDTGIWARSTV